MTVAVVEEREANSASQDSYWDNSNLPEPEQTEELPPQDETHLINPPEKVCPGCGDEIVRVPGTKGRLPKYHAECKPAKGSASSSGPRPVRVTAKDRAIAEEVEFALEQIESKIRKAIMLIAVADAYDAFVLHVNLPEIMENLRPVLLKFPSLRQGASNAGAVTSLFGLGLTVFTTILPILAHHGLIPSKKVAQLLIAVPMFMKRMQENMDDGTDFGNSLIARMREQTQRQNEARMRQQNAEENIGASVR